MAGGKNQIDMPAQSGVRAVRANFMALLPCLVLGVTVADATFNSTICHAVVPTVTDGWCQKNCNAKPPFCPETDCVCGAPTPAPPPTAPPTPALPTPVPPPTPSQGFGQLFIAYFSGIGEDDLPKGSVNSLSLAFFAPDRLAQSNCSFTTSSTCLQPASGAGTSVGQEWAIDVIKRAAPTLSQNTSPRKGAKPTFFFSFGGLAEGGTTWQNIFGSHEKATMFGKNAAKLVKAMKAATGDVAYIGIDLDIEGATAMPEFGSFITAFRKDAAYDEHPLMMCTLSGLMFWDNDDHFKLDVLREHGPNTGGVNYVNMMVDNIAASCDFMSSFWRNETLNFLPPGSRMFGIWGINNAIWIIKDPGCTTGASPLFEWMKSNKVGFGVWQWWIGDPSPVNAVINQVRA